MGKQLGGNGQRRFAVFSIFSQISKDFYFVEPQAGAEFHLVFTSAVQHTLGILKLIMVKEYLSREKIRLIMARINIDGMIIIIYHLLPFPQLIGSLLALDISRIIAIVLLDDLIAGVNTVLILLELIQQVSLVLHGCKPVPRILCSRDRSFHIFHGQLLFLQLMVASAEQVTSLKLTRNTFAVFLGTIVLCLADQFQPAKQMGQRQAVTVHSVQKAAKEIFIRILCVCIRNKAFQQRYSVFRAFILKQAPA